MAGILQAGLGRVGCRPPLFSSDGRHVYVTCGDSIRCHSTRNGEILFTCSGHTDAVSGIAAHPLLSRQIITSSLDGTLRIWDADDGAFIRQVDVGAPISHIATTQLPAKSAAVVYLVVIVKQPKSAAAAALQQHASTRDSIRVDYPLGDEVACLRPRPIGSSFVHTVGPSGATRASPRSAVVELDLNSGNITQLLFRKEGFFVGMEARCMGATPVLGAQQGEVTPDIVLSFAVRRSVYVWRSSAVGSALHKYKHNELLSTLSLHPSDSYVSTGDIVGHVRTWCSPLLSASAAGALASPARQRWTASSSIANAEFEPPIVHDAASIPTSMVHWHAHAVWGTSFLPDGSYMLSGGEEGVLVSWQLSGSHGAGKFGPSKDKRMMNFLPRLGASIRGVASYAVASGADAAAFSADDKAATSGTHVRTTPALMFAAALVDNTFVVINGTTQNEMWRHRGLAIAGCAAIPSVGVMNSLAKYARKQIIKGARSVGARSGARSVSAAALAAALFSASSSSAALSLLADTAGHGTDEDREGAEDPAALLASLSAESIGKSLRKATDRGILMASTTRYLRKGSVVDPRTKCLIVNTLPTKASLQWFDLRKQAGVAEVEVAPRNVVSRMDADPPPPIRVLHVAFSHDGYCMVTLDATSTLDEVSDSLSLKFWQWSDAVSTFVLNTRIENPHKTEITTLEFHPTQRLVVTGSRDRTFKLWEEITTLPVASIAKERQVATSADAPSEPRLVWQCKSVGFYRDMPVTASAFSGDGTCLALGYSHLITLWDWRSNTLRKTLSAPARQAVDEAAIGGVRHIAEESGTDERASSTPLASISNLCFLGLSPYLISTTKHSIQCWDVLSCSTLWTYSTNVISLAADRIGLQASNRFAVVVAEARGPALLEDAEPEARSMPLIQDPSNSGIVAEPKKKRVRKHHKKAAASGAPLDGEFVPKEFATTTPAAADASPSTTVPKGAAAIATKEPELAADHAAAEKPKPKRFFFVPAYYCLVFDAPSAVPLSVHRLPDTTITPFLETDRLPDFIKSMPYSVTFVPAVKGSGNETKGSEWVPAPTDVLIQGPFNDLLRVPVSIKSHVSTQVVKADAKTKRAEHSAAVARTATLDIIRAGMHTDVNQVNSKYVQELATAGDSAFEALINSLGPTQALPASSGLYDMFMNALLPPAPVSVERVQEDIQMAPVAPPSDSPLEAEDNWGMVSAATTSNAVDYSMFVGGVPPWIATAAHLGDIPLNLFAPSSTATEAPAPAPAKPATAVISAKGAFKERTAATAPVPASAPAPAAAPGPTNGRASLSSAASKRKTPARGSSGVSNATAAESDSQATVAAVSQAAPVAESAVGTRTRSRSMSSASDISETIKQVPPTPLSGRKRRASASLEEENKEAAPAPKSSRKLPPIEEESTAKTPAKAAARAQAASKATPAAPKSAATSATPAKGAANGSHAAPKSAKKAK